MDGVISALRNKLSVTNCPKEQNEYFEYFKGIANLLMNKCMISKGSTNYEILEIEFYLYALNHQDVITYPRDTKAGQWFFHQSGVDLAFESDDKHFGGILIRGLRNTETGQLTLGPQKCVDLLWDKSDAFKVLENEHPIIKVAGQKLDENIRNFPRWIPVKDDDKAKKLEYWTERVKNKDYGICPTTDKIDIVFTSPYRFIKYDLINSSPQGWSGYSAKPKVE